MSYRVELGKFFECYNRLENAIKRYLGNPSERSRKASVKVFELFEKSLSGEITMDRFLKATEKYRGEFPGSIDDAMSWLRKSFRNPYTPGGK